MLLLLKPAQLENDPERWNIEVGTRATISRVIAEDFTATLVDLASTFEEEYDGWEHRSKNWLGDGMVA
jgi:hypothetical protein